MKHKIIALALDVTRLTKLVILVLIIFSLYLVAKITWLVVDPVSVATSSWRLPQSNSAQTQTVNTDFSNYQWFGKLNAIKQSVEPEKVTQAPKTRLNLTLSGLVASSKPENSMAIVEYQGKQDTYAIDDKITGTRAVIHQIHPDRLILKNAGKYETLMLDGFDYNAKPVTTNRTINAPTKKFETDLRSTRAKILKDPGKITDYIAITPVRAAGNKIKGYRLNPGRDPSLFKQSGLKRNDLAVSINGYDLTDFSQSIKVMNELKNMTDISITVERDGQLIDIQFGISQ